MGARKGLKGNSIICACYAHIRGNGPAAVWDDEIRKFAIILKLDEKASESRATPKSEDLPILK
jgi:hypothetical protein